MSEQAQSAAGQTRNARELWGSIKSRLRASERTRTITLTLLCAAAAALSAVLFMTAINVVSAGIYLRAANHGALVFVLVSLVAITTASLVTGWLLTRFSPDAAGSGIPQLKVAFWKELGFIPWRTVWVKFMAGVLSIGGGLSLGREGPSVFVGGGIASCLAGVLGVPKRGRRLASVVGASAGLAAAFNTPMGAIAFALEEVVGDFTSRMVGRIMLACVLGALVVHALVGPQPAFTLPSVREPRLTIYGAVLLVAVCATLAAGIFQAGILRVRRRMRALTALPAWVHPCLGGLVTWGIGIVVFLCIGKTGIFGLGYGDLSGALVGGLPGSAAVLLLAGKLVATVVCYGTGGCGGIFSPTLFLGGMTGFAVAGLIGTWHPLAHDEAVLLASVGMCACLGATVRAPWSALLIVFEMTHEFAVVPALLIATLVSQTVIRAFGSENFYDAMLLQDGHVIHAVAPPRTLADWDSMPVSTIATPKPVILPDLNPETLAKTLRSSPYRLFPVLVPAGAYGVVDRADMELALKEGRQPVVHEIIVVRGDQTVREVSRMFIRSARGIILVAGPSDQLPAGLVTLHDLLRAQTALQE